MLTSEERNKGVVSGGSLIFEDGHSVLLNGGIVKSAPTDPKRLAKNKYNYFDIKLRCKLQEFANLKGQAGQFVKMARRSKYIPDVPQNLVEKLKALQKEIKELTVKYEEAQANVQENKPVEDEVDVDGLAAVDDFENQINSIEV